MSFAPKIGYDSLKKGYGYGLSLILGIISLIVYPFVILLIKLDDGGPIFISQEDGAE